MTIEPELDPSRVEVGTFYPHPREVVWQALTDPTLVERWLMASTGFEGARVGTHFLLSVPSSPPSEIACEVLEVTPGVAMTWSWVDMRAPQPARWIVTWTVQPQGRGTRLLLTHSGFDIDNKREKMARNALERGWKVCLSKLSEVLDRL
ncbi:SRPBCC family protein [Rhodococcus marinonascens]|uniref:SRPBCC family protein n=1 Tax=Rhodococcus marinonascens TaxID=38311 RepID=UPI0009343DAE|nr:SRPBCC domain-containing protein [Rhodococcus marinonascens]